MKEKIIVVHETVAESYKKDAGSLVMALALILPGWMLGIDALSWAGVFIFVVVSLGAASREMKRGVMTIDKAREFLDDLEAGK